jgi:hypothetical protein
MSLPRLIGSVAVLLTSITIIGCTTQTGACEQKTFSHTNKDGEAVYSYSCTTRSDENLVGLHRAGEMCTQSDVEGEIDSEFHVGKTCQNLGYEFENGWTFSAGDGYRDPVTGEYTPPGPGNCGEWGTRTGDCDKEEEEEDVASGSTCPSGTTSPYGDVQIDSLCQAACSYLAAGDEDGVKASCDTLKGWERHADIKASSCGAC